MEYGDYEDDDELKDLDHVVINSKTGHIECKHCGDSWHFNGMLPAPINVATAAMRAYALNHKNCKPKTD